jgi:uncharacterized protein YyaL (SSP411 family)
MPNRLAREPSPYLLQHKDNPVNWYPWGPEAFARARERDQPIFLSIGYSTCHWCHVMEHESFEHGGVAERLNRDFVAIKVDREERPDIDRVYMAFVQATTGSGGWPMSVWLTPALHPFYGGTYFPPESRWGRPGFVDVLTEIARAWREERPRVIESAGTIVERLRNLRTPEGGGPVPGLGALEAVVGQFGSAFDAAHGGFGGAPKFPRPSELLFLLREHARTGTAAPLEMVVATLRAMAGGGMYDQLGGGFHRYSVDAEWRVPHFEKMLYDQAQLVLAYLEAWQVSDQPDLVEVAQETLAYVGRDLTGPGGGFYSAEDADSVPPDAKRASRSEKREGAFYVWTETEVREALGGDADVFCLRYGLLPDGNAPADPQEEFVGQNLLHLAHSLDDVAALAGGAVGDVETALARARVVLLARRGTRPRPHLDDKVLTAWNGLMIAALARAGRVLDDGAAELARAVQAATFVRDQLWRPESATLLRRYRGGEAGVTGYAEDFAYLIFGLLELFQAGGDPQWLAWALELQERQDALFWDTDTGGWFSTTGEDSSVLLRLKEDYDGAEPSAASVTAGNLVVFGRLTGEARFAERLVQTLAASAAALTQQGRGVPMMAAALSSYHAPGTQIVIAGEPDAPVTLALRRAVGRRYLPFAVVVPVVPATRERLATILPWIATLNPFDGRPTAYVCRDFTCQLPVSSPDALALLLDGSVS